MLQIGTLTFYCLETESVVGECKVSSEIKDLQICFDDSLDLLALLVKYLFCLTWFDSHYSKIIIQNILAIHLV